MFLTIYLVAYHIKQTQPIFESRREVLRNIPDFWSIVLNEIEAFEEFILAPTDGEILESLTEIFVDRDTSDDANSDDFSIRFEFKGSEYLSDQVLIKKFQKNKDPEIASELISEPVEIKWVSKKNGKKGKNPAKGKSFFKWFAYTGKNFGEFHNASDLALLISEDIFPNAVKYYSEQVSRLEEEDDDDEDGEIELSDEEDDSDHDDAETDGAKDSISETKTETEVEEEPAKDEQPLKKRKIDNV